MSDAARTARRAVMPLTVFAAVAAMHIVWLGVFPEQDPAQSRWAVDVSGGSWLTRYLEGGNYWLGFSYGLSLGFAAVALRRYREGRFCAARNVAIGSVTFSGALSVVGCYLLGCCGSPMLAVYLSLFGAAFVPLAKPLVAGVTLLSILLGWWWMNRRALAPSDSCAPGGACARVPGCEPSMPDLKAG